MTTGEEETKCREEMKRYSKDGVCGRFLNETSAEQIQRHVESDLMGKSRDQGEEVVGNIEKSERTLEEKCHYGAPGWERRVVFFFCVSTKLKGGGTVAAIHGRDWKRRGVCEGWLEQGSLRYI